MNAYIIVNDIRLIIDSNSLSSLFDLRLHELFIETYYKCILIVVSDISKLSNLIIFWLTFFSYI